KTRARICLGAGTMVCALGLAHLLVTEYFPTNFFTLVAAPLRSIPQTAMEARNAIFYDRERRQEFDEYQRSLRTQDGLPELTGTVDSYSFNQSAVLVHGWNYRPRPIFQSYTAYTETLAKLNAEFLKGDKAPDYILFEIAPIDGRFPAM